MRRAVAVALALVALSVAGCGESEQEKAQKQVCGARSDIGKQVDELKGLTVGTATVDGVRANVDAIRADVKDIRDAQGTLSDERRTEVKAATDRFTASFAAIARGVTSDLSLGDAKSRLTAAAHDLAGAYADSLGKIDC
jgi:hypothetical protein